MTVQSYNYRRVFVGATSYKVPTALLSVSASCVPSNASSHCPSQTASWTLKKLNSMKIYTKDLKLSSSVVSCVKTSLSNKSFYCHLLFTNTEISLLCCVSVIDFDKVNEETKGNKKTHKNHLNDTFNTLICMVNFGIIQFWLRSMCKYCYIFFKYSFTPNKRNNNK